MEADIATLLITPPANSIPAGESVQLFVQLRNDTDAERRFYEIAPGDHTLEFELLLPTGETLLLTHNDALLRQGRVPKIHAHPIQSPVAQGAALEQEYQLCQMSGFLPEGRYQIRALYDEGYFESDFVSFEITEPRPIDRITTVWDYDKSALSHLVSLIESPSSEGDEQTLWMEEHENRHDFFFSNHPLMPLSEHDRVVLSHTLTYLSPFRHILFFSEDQVTDSVLVKEGKVEGQFGAVVPPTNGARILEEVFTTPDGTLVAFAASDKHPSRFVLWVGNLDPNGRLNWRTILDFNIESSQASVAIVSSSVRLHIDFEGNLHALVLLFGPNTLNYFKWDAALEQQTRYENLDVFSRRDFRDAFFWQEWDYEEDPAELKTKLELLFRHGPDLAHIEKWTYSLDQGDAVERTRSIESFEYASGLDFVDAVVDKTGILHLLGGRNGRHYYIRFGNPMMVGLDHVSDQLFPKVLLDYNPVEEAAEVSVRYRMASGEYRFLVMENPDFPTLELKTDTLSISEKGIFEFNLDFVNSSTKTLLLPNLRYHNQELSLVVDSTNVESETRIFRAEQPDGRGPDPKHAGDFNLWPIVPNSFRVVSVEAMDWVEVGPDERIAYSVYLPMVLSQGEYSLHIRWEKTGSMSDSLSFKVTR